MENIKKYLGRGLVVLAFLLVATVSAKAAIGGLSITIQNWSGNLVASGSETSEDSIGANEGKLIPFKYNFKEGFAVNGVDMMTSERAINYLESSENIAGANVITEAESGKTFYFSGVTSTFTLPATSSLNVGATYRFVVGGALTGTSTIATASAANEIEGTLIVAGAVVDCDAEDTLTFGASLENIGDYVVLTWSGTYWMLGDSGALTAGSLTCTAS